LAAAPDAGLAGLRPAPLPTVVPASIVSARVLPADIAALDWPALRQAVAGCEACGLCRSRKNTVFGSGDTQARWLVVGEAPGEQEDLQGEPFVGPAGQLLDNMLRAVGLSRGASGAQGVYIANVLKCRPPANRNPQPEEVQQCEPYLRRQVALLQPQIILALGRFAAQTLLHATVPDVAGTPLGKLRGQVHHYAGVPVIVSYHPAYLLRTPHDKARAWSDLCLAQDVSRQLQANTSN
jgi:DNA polymerase